MQTLHIVLLMMVKKVQFSQMKKTMLILAALLLGTSLAFAQGDAQQSMDAQAGHDKMNKMEHMQGMNPCSKDKMGEMQHMQGMNPCSKGKMNKMEHMQGMNPCSKGKMGEMQHMQGMNPCSMDKMNKMQHMQGVFMKKKVIDGYDLSFHVMKAPKGMAQGGTHHVMVQVEQAGKVVGLEAVNSKVTHPNGKSESKMMMKMGDWYMAAYDLGHAGVHKVMVLFKTMDGAKHFGGVNYPETK